ncbi:MAG TPA: hypothetical protein VJZ91_00060, partial [Blastocatellia bacterium]|nr:hypothetical protein [Blastocatellia bacterium]
AFLWLVLLIPCAARVAAQTPQPSESTMIGARVDAQNWRLEQIRRMDEMKGGGSETRKFGAAVEPDAQFYNRKLTEEQKKLLAPAAEEQAAHRDFLRQDHTGLIRLLPRFKYEFNVTVAADRPDLILPIRGGGAFYSFIERKHAFGPWSEITLKEGWLIVGFQPQSLGLMTMLGDVPLESVTAATPGVDYLARLTPPTERAVARDQSLRNFQGFAVAGRSYNAILPAVVNQTYVLRSTVYKKEGRLRVTPGGGSVYIPHPYEYGGADQLIAFRVLSAGDDGSVTVLWKRLQKFSPPKINQPAR